MRRLAEIETTTNTSYHRRLYRQHIANQNAYCTICPPHQGENARHQPKYPIKKAFQLRRLGRRLKRNA